MIIYRAAPENLQGENQAVQTLKNYNPKKNITIGRGFDIAQTYSNQHMSNGNWTAETLTNNNYLVIHNFDYQNTGYQASFEVNMNTGEVIALDYISTDAVCAVDTNMSGYFQDNFLLDVG